ncbi:MULTISPECIES: hypothetical protein [unclassified Streptomyces]|uniref:hypothetical protein n=1 Tax=unclassified Streptomyces TaxID=2593676 RepID=UPI002E80A3F6|nr:hypothetical protein [Streptomyces sp. NBC_00589]WTI37451.1 hypothetical protein OIC96_21750 [Streptomyces sp. NBC_00775]WUB28872.1 hypothetical protein OHA51_27985 [Streptomyces sp. NBC_00589]
MRYLDWYGRILSDTPEARAFKERKYRSDLMGWQVLTSWWIFCLLAGMWLVWGTDVVGEGVGLRIGITVFAIVGYTLAVFIPMLIAKPSRPQD